MQVLVTGASGFLGAHVVARLSREGHHVRALVRPSSRRDHLEALGASFAKGSVEDEESLRAAVRGVDAVIHCAGLVKARDEAEFDRVNVDGCRHLLDAIAAENPGLARLVHVSSIAARGAADDGLPGEELSEPFSLYGASKRRGERLVLGHAGSLPVTVVRPPAIYGPRDVELLDFFRAARLGVVPCPAGPDGRFSAIFVEDCADAIATAVERPHPSGRVYYVDDGAAHTWREMAALVGRLLGRSRSPLSVPVPRAVLMAAAHLSRSVGRLRGRAVMLTPDKAAEVAHPDWVCGHESIAHDLGWTPEHTFERGLARTVAWYRAHDLL